LEGAELVALGVRLSAGAEFPGLALFVGPLAGAALWPAVNWLLLMPQRRALEIDDTRTL
jgi:rod shape-determining protein MreD